MKNWIKVHKKGIIIAIIFLILGMIIAPTRTVEKEKIVEKKKIEYTKECQEEIGPMTETISSLEKENKLRKQIMELDKKLIALGGMGMQYCSKGFYAAANLDIAGMEAVAAKINNMTPQIVSLGDERTALLDQLELIK